MSTGTVAKTDPVAKEALIESKIDKGAVASMVIGNGGLQIQSLGELMEFGETEEIFFKPKRKETEDYITGRFG